MFEVSLIMLGAGDSTRFGLPCKKQWLRVGDDPLWLYATKNLAGAYQFKEVIIASKECDYMKRFAPHFKFTHGGETRQESLKKALALATAPYVMVSDIARPNIPRDLVSRLVGAADKAKCVVPVLKIADTATLNGEYISREDVRLIQTPQLSQTDFLRVALETGELFTDDSGAIKSQGGEVWYIAGDERARKLTFRDELPLLNLKKPSGDIFVGQGYDVHKFDEPCEGASVKICGVKIPYERGVLAHSDGDVALHALCDALFGAAGLGDIGEFFPDSDPAYKGADSKDLLRETVRKVKSMGFVIINADITVVAQSPKLSPYKDEMRRVVAEILGLSENRVNIKATTTEKLGFTGRGEGLAAFAVSNLKYYDWQEA